MLRTELIDNNNSNNFDTTGGALQTFLEEMYSRDSSASRSTNSPAASFKLDDVSFIEPGAENESPVKAEQTDKPRTEVITTDKGTTTFEYAADNKTLAKSTRRDVDGKKVSVFEYLPDGKTVKTFESFDGDEKLKSRMEYGDKGQQTTFLYTNGTLVAKSEKGEKGTTTETYEANGKLKSRTESGEKGDTIWFYENGTLASKFEPMPDGKGGEVRTKYNPNGSKDCTILYDKDGRMTTYYSYFPSGKVSYESVYPKNGPSSWTLYSESGEITSRSSDTLLDKLLR